jgi:hypothetical protein
MTTLIRLIRRTLIRWQLRSLNQQARHIVQARRHARRRLREIWQERDIKRLQLIRTGTPLGT